MPVGIEAMNLYPGRAALGIHDLFVGRGLNLSHFENLLMKQRSIHLPWEDPVSNAVNAAKPIVDALTEEERGQIEMIITSSESGIDFGKSISTYVHRYLGLSPRCRLFEVKQACFGGTAALQMAMSYIQSGFSPNAKVLVLSTDIARNADKSSYAEPSLGSGAMAMLVSNKPDIFEVEFGKSGLHGHEVMDTCRPRSDVETGNPDLSLFTYIDCLENTILDYQTRYHETDMINGFDYFAFHTPFCGMVKGAFRHILRKLKRMPVKESDILFEKKLSASINFPSRIGNLYSGSVYSALCSLICNSAIDSKKRVGIFSYGSGCSSEFYSGFITPSSKEKLLKLNIDERIESRAKITIELYDKIFDENTKWFFGVENAKIDFSMFETLYKEYYAGQGLLVLDEIEGFYRKYKWS
jgi:polyketide biosynthesis 3-hydroxy-3-methylglutaryl-CoA synthase-like enzyme PksG